MSTDAIRGPSIRHATREDIPRVAEVLADAFREDPLISWVIRGDELRDAVNNELLNNVGNLVQRVLKMIKTNSAERVPYCSREEAVERHGGPFFGSGPPRTSVLPRVDGETLVAMRDDPVVMGASRTKQFALEIYLAELEGLQALLDSIVTLIETNREGR